MKIWKLIVIFSVLSLSVMTFVDYIIGEKAEFINAYSVLQRLIGQQPNAGDSMIVQNYGGFAELTAVIIINFIVGVILTSIFVIFKRGKNV